MKFLVTGGAGFIGSNLCERLAQDSLHEIVSIDDYSTGSYDNHVDGVEYFKINTNNIDYLNYKPDIIYHLGEYSRVEASFEDIDKVWHSNVNGTHEVLKFARKTNAKLIYAGSSTKFGDNGSSSSPYAFTKSQNTQLVKNYGEWFGLDYAITYFYNVYGKNEISSGKYATLIALFKEKILNNEPLTVVSPGHQQRNFTHVDDIVDGLLLVGDKGYGDDYGIGSPDTYTVLEIAKIFGSEIEFLPERNGNRMTAELRTGKTQELGWSATRNIKDYINKELGR